MTDHVETRVGDKKSSRAQSFMFLIVADKHEMTVFWKQTAWSSRSPYVGLFETSLTAEVMFPMQIYLNRGNHEELNGHVAGFSRCSRPLVYAAICVKGFNFESSCCS